MDVEGSRFSAYRPTVGLGPVSPQQKCQIAFGVGSNFPSGPACDMRARI